ncbi:uncharacterized protein XM38_044160 [Halomicronema hongdechloris C2206]|uniref:DUF928 domain-containing protein n=1 Tax=Halomicronema hongdechloris C2206 TaxID=1641165 RepID=A0A1Z3HT14_9CYAN|nr:hypothetical protein [Halomicronema hongdechloris]ASC73449.1 uncharacterized protein XM38_044160 [Halomicronema hongdechloris C2206]
MRPGGSRGDLCLVAPATTSPEIWHLNPVFLWQGGLIEALEVHDVASGDSLWRVDLFNFLPRLRYNGPGLEPGREYTWTLYDDLTGDAIMKADFQVMESDERQRIATELEQLTQDLRDSGADPLDIGLARITYFAEQELWADALTEVYLTRPAAPALSHYVREVTKRICGE